MIWVVAAAPRALWYLTRGTGAATLILLTASVVLGAVEVERWSTRGMPRFMVASLHRSLSLLVVVFVAVHVATAVLDTFAPIRLLDAVLPFAGAYRPLWLGLGALALDLLIALVVTSLARRRLGLRAWRGVHWAAYACWPVAAVHGLGTGSDAAATWMLWVTASCTVATLAVVGARLARSRAGRPVASAVAALAAAAAVTGVAVWAAQGPLAPRWARRAGTPVRLLASRPAPLVAGGSPSAGVPRAAGAPAAGTRPGAPPIADALAAGFSGPVRGRLYQGASRGGLAVVDLVLRAPGARVRVRLGGAAAPSGGLVLQRSSVELGPPAHPYRYRGRVTRLGGQEVQALVGTVGGRALAVDLRLQIGGRRVTGLVDARPAPGGSG